jgi:O-antigen ligase
MTENYEKSKMSAGPDAVESPTRLNGYLFFTLCGILIGSALAFGAVDSWALGVLSISAGIITCLWFVDSWKTKGFTFNLNPLQLPLIGLILIGLFQLLPLRSAGVAGDLLSVPAVRSVSLAPYATRLALIHLIVYLLFFAAALISIINHNRLKKIVLTIIIFGTLMAFFGIIQRLGSPEFIYGIRPSLQAIPFGSFINQHHFAAFMEMTIALPLALLFGKATKADKIVLLLIVILLMGAAILLTSSRGGIISLFGVLAFVITANLLSKNDADVDSEISKTGKYGRNFALLGGGAALLLVLFGFVLLLGGDQALLRGTGLDSAAGDVSSGRIHFWGVAFEIFKDYPIFGSGLDSFGTVFPNYDTWGGQFRVEQAHNDYLQILSDAGVLGFTCVAAFIILLFKQGFRVVGAAKSRFHRNTAIGALAGCFGVLIHSFFDFPLRTPSNVFFFLTLAVLATAAISHPKSQHHRSRGQDRVTPQSTSS